MRYFAVANATFVDWNGRSWQVKDMRELPMVVPPSNQKAAKYWQAANLTAWKTTPIPGGAAFLDEIASRPDVYGDGHEADCYLIYDMNADAIASASFDLGMTKRLIVPRSPGGA